MNIEINKRIMKPNDIDECAELFIKAFSPEPWRDKWESPKQAAIYLNEVIDNRCFMGFVVEYKNKIAGVCMGHRKTWYSGDEFNILEFFVDRDCGIKGVGSIMMEYVKMILVQNNIKYITLITGRGYPAQTFYEKHGIIIEDESAFMRGKIT